MIFKFLRKFNYNSLMCEENIFISKKSTIERNIECILVSLLFTVVLISICFYLIKLNKWF
ncbi:hypothetical protein HERIO_708 [Hepatospora eriocheir]|uniref:Uncharacterized protein n=1 Tax=Hepatospora eriocheir TaxID=1081669 RepID=A0A1X0QCD0_9MICR|nr:hypothetical protein HERIO_708 [Hepatospora eriocheir]